MPTNPPEKPLLTQNQRVLAIDFGLKRLGLALSDDRGVLAAPYAVRERKGLKHDIADLTQTITDLRVGSIVFGRPRGLEEGAEHHKTKIDQFAGALESSLREAGLPITIEWWDERFSTAEAWRGLREGGVSSRRGKDQVDAHAAAVILQGYLDACRRKREAQSREAQSREAQAPDEQVPEDN